MRATGSVLLVLAAIGCSGDQSFEPERSVLVELQAEGLPEGAPAEYRILVQDTVPIAHGQVANGETDTVRVSSSSALKIRWQDARPELAGTEYVFAPAQGEVVIDAGREDTATSSLASYSLASGGFALTTPGIPAAAIASWLVWLGADSVLAYGRLDSEGVLRRGDLPPGSVRLQLDTAYLELDGVHHVYAPAQREFPLNVTADLDLLEIDAPYSLVSAAVRLTVAGLPAGTLVPWGMTLSASDYYSVGGYAEAGTVQTLELIRPGGYTVVWEEVTVDGVRYLPNPATHSITLEPGIEPYELEGHYSAAP